MGFNGESLFFMESIWRSLDVSKSQKCAYRALISFRNRNNARVPPPMICVLRRIFILLRSFSEEQNGDLLLKSTTDFSERTRYSLFWYQRKDRLIDTKIYLAGIPEYGHCSMVIRLKRCIKETVVFVTPDNNKTAVQKATICQWNHIRPHHSCRGPCARVRMDPPCRLPPCLAALPSMVAGWRAGASPPMMPTA